jgi:NAD(P)-dependent dehydrogenase (short-subunit alcohol dehydrogenase family)
VNGAPTVLITGSSDGIGLATARELHRRGWHVLVHGRSEAKARATALRIKSKRHSATAVWGDFSNMDSVVDVARQVRAHTATLDALVNNAGVYAKKREITADGFELTMAVNHFAPFLLTHHLLPQLIDAAAARVVTVSSMTHSGASLDLSDLNFEHTWDAYAAYAASKLANILFTRQLAQRLAGTKVSANALHPGVIGTKLLRAGFSMGGGSVEDGARTSVFLVDSVEPRGVSGKYFVDCHEAPVSRAASDPRLAAGLWDASAERLSAFL